MKLHTTKLDSALKVALQKSDWRLVFGGSFDPVHLGHLNLVKQLLNVFKSSKFHLLPCKNPALKNQLNSTTDHRLKMLHLAFESIKDKVFIDLREIQRSGISYTFDSLKQIREEVGEKAPVAFLIGSDILDQLQLWYKFEQFHKLTNLLIIKRPESYLKKNTLLQNFVELNSENAEKPSGVLAVLELQNLLKISSSTVREKLIKGENVDFLLEHKVLKYIKKHDLYKKI